ncbi:MAG TPA: HdeD family acid-resistance protein [Anaerolineaceae bacterium]|nr:HdeD family acid-resistance protein [Anaerolineaceae bacterium]
MPQEITRSWWLFVLRGIAAIIFGILAFASPRSTILALVIVFGIYAVIDGIMAIIAAFQMRGTVDQWWVVLLEGIAGIVVGIIALVYPQITAGAFLFLIAFWAIFTGIMEIIAAISLRRVINNEWSLILSGILSVVLGVLLLVYPSSGAVGLVWAIGLYAILFGVLTLYLAFRIRGSAEKIQAGPQ